MRILKEIQADLHSEASQVLHLKKKREEEESKIIPVIVKFAASFDRLKVFQFAFAKLDMWVELI